MLALHGVVGAITVLAFFIDPLRPWLIANPWTTVAMLAGGGLMFWLTVQLAPVPVGRAKGDPYPCKGCGLDLTPTLWEGSATCPDCGRVFAGDGDLDALADALTERAGEDEDRDGG